jgi:hypothetical protein
MWKKALVCATAIMITGSTIVYAQQGPAVGARVEDKGASTNKGITTGRPRFTAKDMAAFADARIAALHAGLELNSDQEKSWPAFEQALRELTKLRLERFSVSRDQQSSYDPVMRLQRLADLLNTRGTTLKRVADTLAPLYQSFDDGQKRRFTVLARFMLVETWRFRRWQDETYHHHGWMRDRTNYHGDRYRFYDDEDMPD